MYTSQGVAKEGRQQRQRQKIKWKGGSGREERKERGAEERKRKVMRKSRREMALSPARPPRVLVQSAAGRVSQ